MVILSKIKFINHTCFHVVEAVQVVHQDPAAPRTLDRQSHMETLIIYRLETMKFITQNAFY